MASKDFDDHIIFPAHTPFVDTASGNVRVYYMGGNGPHNGARNTSLGLATLRRDGFAGIKGSGVFTTAVKVKVTGKTLRVSVDDASSSARTTAAFGFKIGASGVKGLGIGDCVPVKSGVTDAAVSYTGGIDFTSLIGTEVALEIEMEAAFLYTVSFTA